MQSDLERYKATQGDAEHKDSQAMQSDAKQENRTEQDANEIERYIEMKSGTTGADQFRQSKAAWKKDKTQTSVDICPSCNSIRGGRTVRRLAIRNRGVRPQELRVSMQDRGKTTVTGPRSTGTAWLTDKIRLIQYMRRVEYYYQNNPILRCSDSRLEETSTLLKQPIIGPRRQIDPRRHPIIITTQHGVT